MILKLYRGFSLYHANCKSSRANPKSIETIPSNVSQNRVIRVGKICHGSNYEALAKELNNLIGLEKFKRSVIGVICP